MVQADINNEREQSGSNEKEEIGQISPCKQKYTSAMDQHGTIDKQVDDQKHNKDYNVHKSVNNLEWRHSSDSNLIHHMMGTSGPVSTIQKVTDHQVDRPDDQVTFTTHAMGVLNKYNN